MGFTDFLNKLGYGKFVKIEDQPIEEMPTKKPESKPETPEERAEKILKKIQRKGFNYAPDFFPEKDMIKIIIQSNYDEEEAFNKLKEENRIRFTMLDMARKDKERKIKEEAEKRLYGKVKSKRIAINPEEKEAILRKFDNKCAVCGKTEGLHIHHKDGNSKNNRIDNLTVLCGICHKKIHMNVR